MSLRTIIFAIAIAFLSINVPMSNAFPDAKTFEARGTVDYPSLCARRMLFDDSRFSVSEIVSKADMVMNHFELAFRVPRMHSARPDMVCLLYRNIRAVYTTSEEYQMFNTNGWILKDAYGTLIRSTVYGYYIVDVGNPNYQTWLANWVKSYMDEYGYDGVFMDNCLPSTEIMWSTTPGPAINPRTGKAYTALEFEQAVISTVNTIKNTIGTKLAVGNGVCYGQRFFESNRNQYYVDLLTKSKIDGVQSEAWIMSLDTIEWYSESKWLASIDFAVWLENNFLKKGSGKVFLPVAQNAEPYERPGEALPSGTTREQYADYVFCSLLLAVSSNKTYLNFGYAVDNYTQGLFNVNIGNPMNNYYLVNGTHVYAREYSRVKIMVNPTNTSCTLALDANYTDVTGAHISSYLSLPPHTGIMLNRIMPQNNTLTNVT